MSQSNMFNPCEFFVIRKTDALRFLSEAENNTLGALASKVIEPQTPTVLPTEVADVPCSNNYCMKIDNLSYTQYLKVNNLMLEDGCSTFEEPNKDYFSSYEYFGVDWQGDIIHYNHPSCYAKTVNTDSVVIQSVSELKLHLKRNKKG